MADFKLPPPTRTRTTDSHKVLLTLPAPLYDRLVKLADQRGEAVATCARILLDAALTAAGK